MTKRLLSTEHTMLCRSGIVPCHERKRMKQTWLPIIGIIVIGTAWVLFLTR